MPRRPRLHVPDGLYHVTLRGNHRQPIFWTDSDRRLLEEFLVESLQRYACRVYAYCWMTNHIHLAVQVSDTPLGSFIRHLASRYARAVQCRIPTTGHLFERRYRASLVNADAYLLAMIRYVHLNPVRAGLASDPVAYLWSGHRAYLGLARVDWLSTELGLSLFGTTVQAARDAYREFMMATPDPDELTRLRGGNRVERTLGDAAVSHAAEAPQPDTNRRPSLEDLIIAMSVDLGVSPAALETPSRARHLSRARAMIARRALAERIATLTEIAARFNRTPATLCVALQRHAASVPGNNLIVK